MSALNPVHTVGAQLAEAYRAHHDVSRRVARSRAVEALELVGIPQPARRADQYPHEFSGGMRQRVVIAMAVINDPRLLIADEPTTALDVTVQAQILETLQEVRERTGAAIMMITHDLGVVAGIADRVQVMYGGTVVESGPVDEVFAAPRMPYTARPARLGADPELVGRPADARPGRAAVAAEPAPACTFAPRCPLVAEVCREAEPELLDTDRPGHPARCHRWPVVAGIARPQELFARREIGHPDTEVELVDAPQVPRTTGDRAAGGPRPGQALPGARARRRAPHRGAGAGGVGRVAGRRRGRDARARRRVRLRQVDRRAGDPAAAPADVGLRTVRRPGADDAVAAAAPRRAPRHADRLPGPVRLAQPAVAGQRHRRRAAAHPRDGATRRRRPAPGRRAARDRGAQPRAPQPLPARVLRRPAAARRHRPGARARAAPGRARRARLGARRLGAGAVC